MRLPDLLASRRGRLAAFFLLYLTEGLPSGFTGTAVATQMRRQGLQPAAIGAFIGALYVPWAIKWAFGPFVDVLGGYALSLSLQSNLAVELGLDDRRIGLLGLGSTALSAGFCVLGGWLSDRLGRRRTLATFIVGTTLPTFAMAIAMHRFGWTMPISPQAPDRPIPPRDLVTIFWVLTLSYAVFQGLMYGVGTAIY